jgi:DNA-binding LacI/PurR family transcriptional regulator
VDCDHDYSVAELTRHLIDSGHSRISLVNGPEEFSACALRAGGYRSALADAGLSPAPEINGPFSADHGYHAGLSLLDLPTRQRPTAVVAASDVIAVGCMEAARARGVRIPDELAITGFDDTLLARYSNPALTTVRVPLEDMGRMAVQILFSLMRGKRAHPRTMVLPSEVILRASSDRGRRLLQ